MFVKHVFVLLLVVVSGTAVVAQQASDLELKIERTNRTLTVSADERVTADPEMAILHIGYETQPMDAKDAYASGAKISNQIIAALKQAGIPENSIRSERQNLQSTGGKAHKYKLVQEWTVKTTPVRAAEILDIAVGAGATDSGEIEWTVKDEKALEDQALERAATRAKSDAEVLAKGMDVHLGPLIFVTNQVSKPETFGLADRNYAGPQGGGGGGGALAIEPRKVSRVATVYAVFAIE